MGIRERIAEQARPILLPGERIQAVMSAATHGRLVASVPLLAVLGLLASRDLGDGSPLLVFVLRVGLAGGGLAALLANEYRTVVVTDRRILVCRSGRIRTSTVGELLWTVHRATRIGPPRGLWYRARRLGPHVDIHLRFHRDIEEADALAPPPPESLRQ